MSVDKHFYPIIASEASLLVIQPAVCMYMYLDSDNPFGHRVTPRYAQTWSA